MTTSRTPRKDGQEEPGKGRIPVSSNRAPLTYRGLDRDNFVPRWVLDKDDRISMFLEAGYEFVKPTQKVVGDRTVESTEGVESHVYKMTGGRKQYLMQLKKEWYDADQLLKQKDIDEMENTMRHPKTKAAMLEGVDYGNVSITTGKGDKI